VRVRVRVCACVRECVRVNQQAITDKHARTHWGLWGCGWCVHDADIDASLTFGFYIKDVADLAGARQGRVQGLGVGFVGVGFERGWEVGIRHQGAKLVASSPCSCAAKSVKGSSPHRLCAA